VDKKLNPKNTHDEILLLTVGNFYRVKRFGLGCKRFTDDEEVETELRKWLRQQSKGFFYAMGFDALVQLWDKCVSVSGGYIEK
jgi:hypothetical protein